jgi:hypothetical protein
MLVSFVVIFEALVCHIVGRRWRDDARPGEIDNLLSRNAQLLIPRLFFFHASRVMLLNGQIDCIPVNLSRHKAAAHAALDEDDRTEYRR